MKWEKKGLIYCTDGRASWIKKHAMLPTPWLLDENTIRIFIGFCDEHNVGRIGYVDVDANNPSHLFSISESPVLDVGQPGAFDDNGVVPVSIIRKDDMIFLYYIGFQLGVKVPYYMFCGLALSNDGGQHFRRYSQSPVLDRTGDELFARSGVNVIYDDNLYKMWYVGSYDNGWVQSQGKLRPLYCMKYVTSQDGIHWDSNVVNCFQPSASDEHGFGRPYVWKQKDLYKMLYSVRTYSHGYHIGFAESKNGMEWIRKDHMAGIALSTNGWDSENMSYPFLVSCNNKTYMFYNGNNCGQAGFGYAELTDNEY